MDIFEEDAKKSGNRGNKAQVAEIDGDSLLLFLEKEVTGEVTEKKGCVETAGRECAKWCGVTGCGVSGGDAGEWVRNFRPDYGRLIVAGIADGDVDCLEGAEFLFTLEKVKNTAGYEFKEMRERFVPYWRKRLQKEAWGIVGEAIKERLKNG